MFGLFACGFVSELGNNRLAGVSKQASKSRTAGTYNSPAGRLSSSDTCSENDDCKDLCDSMLKKLSDQKDCYKKKEKEVQVFRDVYNLLATGDPRRMVSIDSDEMEDFLAFGPVLWKDAIYGFERNKKENCEPDRGRDDPRDREDCKLKGYYKQEGYDEEGAGEALKWIARNNWVAELLLEHDDEDNDVMLSLLDVLAFGEGGVEAQPDNLNCASGTNDHPCHKLHDSSFGGVARHVLPESTAGLKQHYSYLALANPLVAGGRTYFSLAGEDTKKPSYKLGEEILEGLCSDASSSRRSSCESAVKSPGSVAPCPRSNPPAAEKLATLTFNNSHSGPMHRYYWIAGGYCYPGTPQVEKALPLGSSSRSQNIILDLNDYQYLNRTPFGVLFLNDAEISYSSRKTYYLYLDNNRYPLEASKKQDDYTENCGTPTRTREVIWWSGIFTAKLTKNEYNVWIASEEDGVCTFYKP